MTNVLNDLVALLKLEKVESNVYRGESQDLGFRSMFGGQVLGQALIAACETVETWLPHSLHAYFLRPGDVKEPLYYEVDWIRSGRTFSTRRVVAKQCGRPIFNLSASFKSEEQGFEHQDQRPAVPGPDGLPSELELARMNADKIPESIRSKFTCDRPIELRVVDPINHFNPHKRPPVKYSWFKAIDDLPEDPKIHYALLAYASDFGLGTTAMLPHGKSFIDRNMHVASIDHAMWFHRKFRMDDWLLYSKDSPSAFGGIGFNRGQIYSSKDGSLVASVCQESLIREKRKK